MKLSDISLYLPKYLSAESEKELFKDIGQFTTTEAVARYYASGFADEDAVYQGDCIAGLPFVSLPRESVQKAFVLILSNTCDIHLENKRPFPAMVSYCPIIPMKKYLGLLQDEGFSKEKLEDHSRDIRAQRITQIFFLPAGAQLLEDHIAFLDRACHAASDILYDSGVIAGRKASLSNFGFYLFLLKLSIHFTRIREGVDRV